MSDDLEGYDTSKRQKGEEEIKPQMKIEDLVEKFEAPDKMSPQDVVGVLDMLYQICEKRKREHGDGIDHMDQSQWWKLQDAIETALKETRRG
jgi:hypothetical protein